MKKERVCIICRSKSNFFFTKKFQGAYKKMLTEMDFYKCCNCGFTFSPTIYDMNEKDFSKLNIAFHEFIENPINEKLGNQPPYIEQASFINILNKNKLIDMKNAVDFAGGYGSLNKILKKYYINISFLIYDPYMQDQKSNDYINKAEIDKHKTVFNSAFFEHLRSRETLDDINNCVDNNGVLLIHTVICENIPKDENWFYLKPVHCSFHTNKSMEILMQQWGYKWSLYCPGAKTWALFKEDINTDKEKIITNINKESQTNYLVVNKTGFVDYWKGF